MNSIFDNMKMDILAESQAINTTTTERTRYFDMTDMHTACFFLQQTGTSASDLASVALVQATDSSGTGKKAISGATLADAQFVDAAALDSWQLELDAIALDHENDFKFVAVEAAADTGTPADLLLTVVVVANPAYKTRLLSVAAEADLVKVPAGGAHGS